MLSNVGQFDITKFAAAPTTQSTYNQILYLAQEIELRKVEEFISTGVMPPYSDQEIHVIVLSDFFLWQ